MENKTDQYIESLISEVSELKDKNKSLLEEITDLKNMQQKAVDVMCEADDEINDLKKLHLQKVENIGILNSDRLRLLEENKQLKSRIIELKNQK